MSKSAAIIGFGVINPIACTINEFKEALRNGNRELSTLTNIPIPHSKGLAGLISKNSFKKDITSLNMSRSVLTQALSQSGIDLKKYRTSLFLATMSGETKLVEDNYIDLKNCSLIPEQAYSIIQKYPTGWLTRQIGNEFNCFGPRLTISNACASGNIACGLALDFLRQKMCDVAVIIGVEVYKLSSLWGAERAGFIGTRLAPFDLERDGAILGEGAAAIILVKEELSSKFEIHGWLSGFGCVCDKEAGAITLAADGSGLLASMQLALNDNKYDLNHVDYINMHAPGTKAIDYIECLAVKNLFGDASSSIAINSTKSLTTHLAGASAVTEIIATVIQMNGGFVHGNRGLTTVDPTLAVKVQPDHLISKTINLALSNACGGGGLNSTVVINKNLPTHENSELELEEEEYVITGTSRYNEGLEKIKLNFTHDKNKISSNISINDHFPAEFKYQYLNSAAQLAAILGKLALEQANIKLNNTYYPSNRVAVISGTTLGGGIEGMEAICDILYSNPKLLKPSDSLDHGIHLGASLICRYYGFTGITYTLTGNHHAGLQALYSGLISLKCNRADLTLILGYDTCTALQNQVFSYATKHPNKTIFINCGGSLVLEKENEAKKRNVKILGKIKQCINFTLKSISRFQFEKFLEDFTKTLLAFPNKLYLLTPIENNYQYIKQSIIRKFGYLEENIIEIYNDKLNGLAGLPIFHLLSTFKQPGVNAFLALEKSGSVFYIEIECPK